MKKHLLKAAAAAGTALMVLCATFAGPGAAFASAPVQPGSTPADRLPGDFVQLVCPSSTHCAAIGTDANGNDISLVSSNMGRSWAEHMLPPGSLPPLGLACPSVSVCFALVGYGLMKSTDGGASWTVETTNLDRISFGLGPVAGLVAITCPTVSDCFLLPELSVGQTVGLLKTTDGGDNWVTQHVPLGPVTIPEGTGPTGFSTWQDISCSNALACAATAGDNEGHVLIAYTTDGGANWHASSTVPEAETPYGVSCYNPADCVVVASAAGGSQILVTNNGGISWESAPVPAGAGILRSVSCVEPREARLTCAAVGATPSLQYTDGQAPGTVITTTDPAVSWSTHKLAFTAPLFAVACRDGSGCVAGPDSVFGGRPGVFVSDRNGNRWTKYHGFSFIAPSGP